MRFLADRIRNRISKIPFKSPLIVFLAAIVFAQSTFAATRIVSRANCGNNESITWDDNLIGNEWRLTFSYHNDRPAGRTHYAVSGPLWRCTATTCWYYYEYTAHAPAIHWFEGGVPGTSDRWSVGGDHRHYYPGFGFTRHYTFATDCNLP